MSAVSIWRYKEYRPQLVQIDGPAISQSFIEKELWGMSLTSADLLVLRHYGHAARRTYLVRGPRDRVSYPCRSLVTGRLSCS